jgi:hypothetical protein
MINQHPLQIKVFNNEAVPEVEISLGEFSTIFDLKQELQSMTGIPVDEQYLCNVIYSLENEMFDILIAY